MEPATEDQLSALSELDLSAEVANRAAAYSIDHWYGPFQLENHQHEPAWLESLSTEQRMQLGGWLKSDESLCTLTTLWHHYRDYEETYSTAPPSGIDLLELSLKNSNLQTAQKILSMSPSEQLDYLSGIINPQTGKIYGSLIGPVTEPGAVRIRQLNDYEEVKAAFGSRPGAGSFLQPGAVGAWEFAVYGTDFSSPLDTTVIVLFDREPPDWGTPSQDRPESEDIEHIH